MQPSELRHAIEIQKRVPKPGGGHSWQKFATAMAAIDPLSAREFMNNSDQVLGRAEARVKIWWLNGIDATMRIVHGAIIYNILGVLEDNQGGRRWITMPVARGTNDG